MKTTKTKKSIFCSAAMTFVFLSGLLSAAAQLNLSCDYSALSSGASAANVRGAAVGENGAALFDLGAVSGTSGTINSTINLTTAQIADLRANKFYANIHTASNPCGEIRGQLHIANNTYNDVDGDGRSDLTVFRPSNGFRYLDQSADGFRAEQWGQTGDQ